MGVISHADCDRCGSTPRLVAIAVRVAGGGLLALDTWSYLVALRQKITQAHRHTDTHTDWRTQLRKIVSGSVYAVLADEDTTIAAGHDSEEMCFHITHAGMAPVSRTVDIERPKFTAGSTLAATDIVSAGAITTSGGAVSTVTTTTTASNLTTNNDKTGYRLSATGVDDIFDEIVEGIRTFRQILRGYSSALLAKLSGGGTATEVFRDIDDSKNRITATVDADGNRTAITLDLT